MIEYYTIAVISILAAISPGPDFVIVVKNALTHNRNSAIITAFGVGTGALVHSTYCILGLAIIISESILIFNAIKYLGASYLIYLGIKSLMDKSRPAATLANSATKTNISNLQSFRDGFFTNVLNPKCTLFILSVFTLVVKPHTPLMVQSIYALEISFVAIAWFVFLSCLLTHQFIKDKISKVQHIVNKITGAVLLALGLSIIYKTNN